MNVSNRRCDEARKHTAKEDAVMSEVRQGQDQRCVKKSEEEHQT